MLSQPRIATRLAQPYIAIGRRVILTDIAKTLPPLIPELFGWLARNGHAPGGAPFFRYLTIDMERFLDVEVGIPLAAPIPGDENVHAGTFPAGRYASLMLTGAYDGLVAANAALQIWARENGHHWAMTKSAAGEEWACRLEIYLSDPATEPDPANWQTEIAYLLG